MCLKLVLFSRESGNQQLALLATGLKQGRISFQLGSANLMFQTPTALAHRHDTLTPHPPFTLHLVDVSRLSGIFARILISAFPPVKQKRLCVVLLCQVRRRGH